ncbi:hypothetical protein C8R45DRAFT_1134299 [Mycena sanguinolenta]|nr:hypothetical protein C8R45DRAFT_1134299 [Mycena sanguinolenta]
MSSISDEHLCVWRFVSYALTLLALDDDDCLGQRATSNAIGAAARLCFSDLESNENGTYNALASALVQQRKDKIWMKRDRGVVGLRTWTWRMRASRALQRTSTSSTPNAQAVAALDWSPGVSAPSGERRRYKFILDLEHDIPKGRPSSLPPRTKQGRMGTRRCDFGREHKRSGGTKETPRTARHRPCWQLRRRTPTRALVRRRIGISSPRNRRRTSLKRGREELEQRVDSLRVALTERANLDRAGCYCGRGRGIDDDAAESEYVALPPHRARKQRRMQPVLILSPPPPLASFRPADLCLRFFSAPGLPSPPIPTPSLARWCRSDARYEASRRVLDLERVRRRREVHREDMGSSSFGRTKSRGCGCLRFRTPRHARSCDAESLELDAALVLRDTATPRLRFELPRARANRDAAALVIDLERAQSRVRLLEDARGEQDSLTVRASTNGCGRGCKLPRGCVNEAEDRSGTEWARNASMRKVFNLATALFEARLDPGAASKAQAPHAYAGALVGKSGWARRGVGGEYCCGVDAGSRRARRRPSLGATAADIAERASSAFVCAIGTGGIGAAKTTTLKDARVIDGQAALSHRRGNCVGRARAHRPCTRARSPAASAVIRTARAAVVARRNRGTVTTVVRTTRRGERGRGPRGRERRGEPLDRR